MESYRPPPAQAQAQPAQAQAQAQAHPPPPERPPPLPVDRVEGAGGGLVTFAMPLVNSVTLPMTLVAKFWAPLTMEAAKSDPGNLGMEGVLGMVLGAVLVGLEIVDPPYPGT